MVIFRAIVGIPPIASATHDRIGLTGWPADEYPWPLGVEASMEYRVELIIALRGAESDAARFLPGLFPLVLTA
ncbi:hypothetical protein D3C85_1683420 [compost metagenome]